MTTPVLPSRWYPTGKQEGILENEPSLSPSGHSRRSRSSKEPWMRPAQSRAKINDKVSWDGLQQSFRAYKKTLYGHLIQVNAGYLINPQFLKQYETNQGQLFLQTHAFWNQYQIPFAQAKADCSYLYGILLSTCKGFESAILNDTSPTFDGISAWIQFLRNYDNNGYREAKLNQLDN